MIWRTAIRHLLLVGFGSLLFSIAALAKDKPGISKSNISVKAEVDRAFITIGDPVEYTVTIRHDPSVQILSQIPPPSDEILKIKKIEEFKREESGMRVEGRKFKLTAFRLGEFILDPVQVEYRAGSEEPKKIETNRIFLTVQSVAKGEEKKDIRGIKAVLSIPRKILGLIASLLVLALLVTAFYLWRFLRKRPSDAKEPETLLSAEEQALLRLNQLFESDLLRRGKVKEYYLRLSEILRIYFEKRFQILAIESTTYEILRLMRRKDIPRPLLEKVEEVLEAADLAKFAKWKPEPAQVIQINQKSKQIVEESKPPQEVVGGV